MRQRGEQVTETTHTCALGRRACQPRNLTEAVHCVARHSGIDTHALAERLEADYATFIRWTEPNGICQLPARKLAALAQHTGRFDHLSWIAIEAGLFLSRRLGTANETCDRVHELLDIGEQVGKLCAADRDLSNGGFNDQEKATLRRILQSLGKEIGEYEQALSA